MASRTSRSMPPTQAPSRRWSPWSWAQTLGTKRSWPTNSPAPTACGGQLMKGKRLRVTPAGGSSTGRCRSSRWASTRPCGDAASRASCWRTWRPMRATWARPVARSRCGRGMSVRRSCIPRSASVRWACARVTTPTARTPSSWRALCRWPGTMWPAWSWWWALPATMPAPSATKCKRMFHVKHPNAAPSSSPSNRPATRRRPPSSTATARSSPTSWPRRSTSMRASAVWCPRSPAASTSRLSAACATSVSTWLLPRWASNV